jgi:hypothetical protein
MSQYPPPYSQPPVQPNYGYDFSYYQSQDDLLAPARRAGVMMFVIGGLLALGGLCCGGLGAFAPIEQVMAQNPMLNSTPGMTVEILKMGIIVMGVLALLFGLAMLVLGYFVRGGGIIPVVIAIVLVALATLFNLVNLASTAMQVRGGGPEMLGGMCVNVIPLVMLLVLLAMLIQAAKAAPRVAMMKSQYQQQLWQYQQQQQMYQAGYVAPPPPPMQSMQQQPPQNYGPPMPPPVPPPPPSDTSSPGDPNGPSA